MSCVNTYSISTITRACDASRRTHTTFLGNLPCNTHNISVYLPCTRVSARSCVRQCRWRQISSLSLCLVQNLMRECYAGLFFEYDPPVVTSISTDHGSIAGGLAITVTGYGFGMADTQPAVSIGLSPCEEDSWISDTSMRCTTPAGQVRACVTLRQRRRSVVW